MQENKIFTNRFFNLLIVALLMVISISPVGTARAGGGPKITREIRHAFSTVQHFDPIPGCELPGSTEYATGNDHLIIVDQGDSWHVTFGETFHILVVYDDPTWPNETRQGTDALHFNITKGGTVTFIESFHDFARRGCQSFIQGRLLPNFRVHR